MNFNYADYPTLNVSGKRIYEISSDRLYPSITTVLGHTQEQDKKTVLERWKARVGNKEADRIGKAAADRGTHVHTMIERQLLGVEPFKIDEFPENSVNLFKSLRLELKKINKVIGQEVVLYSDQLKVAGRCDLIAEYNNTITIVDYKTSSRVKSANDIGDYFIQAVFYLLAHNEMFDTNIEKMVIMMGVENRLPLVFKKDLSEDLIIKLFERVDTFYKNL